MNLAKSVQVVTEEVMLRTVRHIHKVTGEKYFVSRGRCGVELRGKRSHLAGRPF